LGQERGQALEGKDDQTLSAAWASTVKNERKEEYQKRAGKTALKREGKSLTPWL